MSSQVRRDRRERPRFTSQTTQQTWVPRGTSSTSVVVNETPFPLDANTNFRSLDSGARTVPDYQQRQDYESAPLLNNPHQRSNVPGPPSYSRQRRNNASRPVLDNRQRGGSRACLPRSVHEGTGLDKEWT